MRETTDLHASAIKGTTLAEIKVKEKVQLARRASLVKHFEERKKLDNLSELAEYDTGRSQRFIKSCKSILKNNLGPAAKTDWTSLYDDQPYTPFVFKEPVPRYKRTAKEVGVPQKSFFSELFFPSARKQRESLESKAKKMHSAQMQEHEKKKELERAAHEKKRSAHIAGQEEYNRSVEQFQLDFEKGRPEAIESFARIALARLLYPDLIELDFDAWYDLEEKLILIDAVLPGPLEIPGTIRSHYNKDEHGISTIEMDPEEFSHFYGSILLQVTLGAINAILESTPARHIRQVAYNGYIRGIAPETATESKSCILTCKVSRDAFETVDLAATPPGEVFSAIKGVMVEPLTEINPVRPLVNKRPVNPGQPPDKQSIPENRETYRPGDISHAAQELMTEVLDQIEKSLIEDGEDGEKKILH